MHNKPNPRYRLRGLSLAITLGGFLLLWAWPSHAELGGAPRTMGSRFSLGQVLAKYTAMGVPYQIRQESDNSSKLQWTEYIANNTVFAIEWSGNEFPDLNEAVGAACYQDYLLDLSTRQPGNHRHSTSQLASCTVATHGRPGQFFGRAYIPALLPLGFDLSSFQ